MERGRGGVGEGEGGEGGFEKRDLMEGELGDLGEVGEGEGEGEESSSCFRDMRGKKGHRRAEHSGTE